MARPPRRPSEALVCRGLLDITAAPGANPNLSDLDALGATVEAGHDPGAALGFAGLVSAVMRLRRVTEETR